MNEPEALKLTALQAAALQAWAAAIGIPLLFATFVYTLRTLAAAGRQAEAGENTANASLLQLASAVSTADKETQPILQIELKPDLQEVWLRNVGLGPAFEIQVVLAMHTGTGVYCPTNVLAVGQAVRLQPSWNQMEFSGLRVDYVSTLSRPHRVTFSVSDLTLDFEHVHESFPAKFDELWDISFQQATTSAFTRIRTLLRLN